MSPGNLRTGVFLIITGVILLLNTTGQLAWAFWVDLIWLWPMLLIALGVEKLFLATKVKKLAYLSSLILVLTVVWAWASYAGVPRADEPTYDFDADFNQTYPLDSTVEALVADIDFGAGRLTIGSTPDQLFDGSFYSEGRRPRVTMSKHRGRVTVRIRSRDQKRFHWPHKMKNRWQVKLTDRLPVRLNIDCGAARLRLNLADIRLERFNIDCGASEIDLTIGVKCPRVNGYIDCGVSHVDIRIPRGAGLRVHRDVAISSFRSGEIDLRKRGSYHETENFEDAAVQINLDVDAGVSALRISYSDEAVGPGAI